MADVTFDERRGRIEAYFDRTAFAAWADLTSDRPVSRIRQTVRSGRNRMHATLLGWLPADLAGRRVLDAGCGTGALTFKLAEAGADVVAVDVSASLVAIAERRLPAELDAARIAFRSGDMLDPAIGMVDHVVAMDSLIHYETSDALAALARLAARTRRSIVFTLAPRTPALALMHAVGRLFPRRDRAPAIVPAGTAGLNRRLAVEPGLRGWRLGRTARVTSGFYISQAYELVRA